MKYRITELVTAWALCKYLYRGVSLDVLGSFKHSQVGEAQLVRGLNQTHAVLPHVQQDAFDVHWWRVFPLVHLNRTALSKLAKLTRMKPCSLDICWLIPRLCMKGTRILTFLHTTSLWQAAVVGLNAAADLFWFIYRDIIMFSCSPACQENNAAFQLWVLCNHMKASFTFFFSSTSVQNQDPVRTYRVSTGIRHFYLMFLWCFQEYL